MDRRFQDRTVIVTGGASGIGLAIARRFAQEGASIMIADLDAAKASQAAETLAKETDAAAWGEACDVSDQTAVAACAKGAVDRSGRLDIVVNNAGLMTFKPIADFTDDDWLEVLRVDLLGAAAFTRQLFHLAGDKGGCVVNIASIHAVRTEAHTAPYAAAKAGLLSLTRTTSIEGRDKKIRANAILPGAIDTPMLWDNPNVKSGLEKIDKADVGLPDDIAAAAAFLASDDAAFISGTSLVVDGGRLARL